MQVDIDARLNEKELEVLRYIGDAYYAFAELEVYHPADHDEFVFHVHAMGRIVMARSAARAHPERGWIKGPQSENGSNAEPG